jgi:hypothetical protein
MNDVVLLDFGNWTPLVRAGVVLVCAGTVALCTMATVYLARLNKNSLLQRAFHVAGEAVVAAVASVVQDMKPELEAAAADGKITAAEWANLVEKALASLKKSGSQASLGVLEKAFGENYPAWLRNLVQATLGNALPNVEFATPAVTPVPQYLRQFIPAVSSGPQTPLGSR